MTYDAVVIDELSYRTLYGVRGLNETSRIVPHTVARIEKGEKLIIFFGFSPFCKKLFKKIYNKYIKYVGFERSFYAPHRQS